MKLKGLFILTSLMLLYSCQSTQQKDTLFQLMSSKQTGINFVNTVENTNDFSSVAGDWTLEYLLSPDGKFRAKMYNRNTYNSVSSGLENTNTTSAGFSLIHTQTFNNINELFSKKGKNQNPQDVSLNTGGDSTEAVDIE